MAFLTANQTIIRSLSDGFNDPTGALSAAKWTLIDIGNGLPQTTRDIDATSSDIREPSTAVIAPHAYFAWYAINNPLTFRVSMSVKGTSTNGAGSFIILFRPDQPVGLGRLVARVGLADTNNAGSPNPMDSFQLRWRGQVTNVTFAATNNVYYRVGIEVDAEADIVRGYLNPTGGVLDSSGDSNLEVRATFGIDTGTVAYDDNTIYVGIGLSATASSDTNYSGAENILIEEWQVPFSANFPAGSFFQVHDTPYSYYKTSLSIHDHLTRARLA